MVTHRALSIAWIGCINVVPSAVLELCSQVDGLVIVFTSRMSAAPEDI